MSCLHSTFSLSYSLNFLLHSIQLSAPRTSGVSNGSFFHDGIILKLCLDDNTVGLGEVYLYCYSNLYRFSRMMHHAYIVELI
jgi:hypothetical protein